jgi:hypothetical protein
MMRDPAAGGSGHDELIRWYLEHLRPGLARAARRGRIRPEQAALLERRMRPLLALERSRRP